MPDAVPRGGGGRMAAVAITFLTLAAASAVLDWIAVAYRFFRLEYLFKPLTLALLTVAAATADLGTAQPWIVAGLVLGLAGDVGLMLSREQVQPDPPFLLGLTAFLLGHLCFLVGFLRHGLHGLQLVAGALVAGGIAALALPAVLAAVRRVGGTHLAAVVGSYAAVLAAMAALAVGTGSVLTAVGGLLFLASDTVLARDRFVRPHRRGPLAVIVSYHAAQLLIVAGLVRRW